MAKDTVDTRVVRMEFDNKQFEKNIRQTSKSLDNFKRDLDFKGVGDSLEKVKVKFSSMQVAATTFIVNLTNRLIQLGSTLVKSFSVDNISAGWAKFGEKTTSVATMMAQKIRIAGEEITDLARKTEVVNEQLELLTWFSDETSYSFTDMVNNVGKFIAAGQDLDVSVKAMEGIATWAAKAGQNSQTASRAMYQLAQAMGKGKIQKIDWMSIQNANMDTEDFRETILATAVAMGELTKEGDKFITKTGKKFTQSQFADFLSEGWFTSDVLVKGLSKYSAAVEQIYEIANREGITASEVMEKYADQLDEFGMSAFKAAQEARTFSDVLNSVKDAVSSKWMQTFENIFGGQENAVKLWTELANELYDVFAESGNFRNDILAVWKEFGGRDDIFGEHGEPNQGAFWNFYDAIIAVRDLIKKAWNNVFPLSQMENASDQVDDIARRLKDLTQRIKDFTYNLKMSEEFGSRLSKVFQVIFSLLKGGLIVLKTIRFIIDPIIELGKQLVGQVLDQIIYSTNKLLKVGNGFEAFAVRLQNIVANLIDSLNAPAVFDEVFAFIRDTFKILENLHPIESLIRFIEDFTQAFEDAGGTSENFKKIINSVLSVISLVRKAIVSIALTLTKYVVPVLDDIIDILVKVAGFILGTAVKIVSIIADLITNINNAFQGKGNAEEFKNEIFGILEQLGNLAKSIIPIVGSLIKIILKLVEVVLLLPKMLNELSKRLTGKGIIDNLNSLFDGIINAISNFVNGIKNAQSKPGSFAGLFNALVSVIEGLWEVVKGLLSIAQLVLTALGSALKKIGLAIQYIADIFIKVFSGRANELTSAEKQMLGVIAALGVLALIGITLYNMIWLIASIFRPISVLVDSMTGLMDSLAFKFKMGIFESFANALLKFAVSIVLLSNIDTQSLYRSLLVMSSFVAIIGLFAIVLTNMTKAVTTFSQETIKIDDELARDTKYNNMLRQIAYVIESFGKSLLLMSLSLLVISKINEDSLLKGITTFISIFGMMALLLYFIKNISEKDINASALSEVKKIMIRTALTMIIVAIAFKKMSLLSSEQLSNAILGYASFMLGILLLLHIIDSARDINKVSDTLKSLISVAAILLALTVSIKVLSGIKPGPLWVAVGAIATLILAFTAAIILINKLSSNIKINVTKGAFAKYSGIALMLVALSGTLLVMSASIATLALIPWKKLIAPVAAMVILLGSFATAIRFILVDNRGSSIKKARNIAIVLGALAVTINSMAVTLVALSFIPWYKLLSSTLAMSAMLAAFTASIVFINKSINHKKLASVAKTLLVMGSIVTSIIILAAMLKMLSGIPWQNILIATAAIIAIMAALTTITYLLNKMSQNGDTANSILKVASAFAILAVAIIPLAYSLRMFSDIPLINIGKGFLVIVGGILVLAVAAKLLGAVVPIMAAISGTLLLVGMATLSAAIGLRTIAEALVILNQDFTPALENLTNVITGVITSITQGLLNTLPQIIEVITVVIGVILDSLTELVPKIINLISAILDGILSLLNKYAVPFIEATVTIVSSIIDGVKYLLKTHGTDIIDIAVTLLDKLIKTVSEHMEFISQSLMDIVKSILSALESNIGDIVNLLAGIVIGLLDGLRKNIGPITKALIDFLIEATIALFQNIGPLLDIVTDYVFDFIARVTVALTGKLIALAGLITKVVLIVLAAVIRLTIASLGALSKLFVTFVAAILLILVHTFIGLSSTLLEIFKVVIKESLKVLVEAIIWAQDVFVAIGKLMLSLILRGIINTMLVIGSWILDVIDTIFGTNLKEKLQGVADNLANEARNMVNSISAGTDKVEASIKNAANNINGVVSMTANMANEAVISGMGAISDTVSDSMDQLGDAMQQFGEEAGSNLYTGMGNSDNIDGANQVGQDMGNATAEGFATATETHSPSRLFARFGNFLMEGLGLGIQNGAYETENAMAEVISDSLQLATDILEGQDGDDYTIKVGMDISSVEAQTSKIQDMMSGVNNPNITASGKNAGYNAKALERNNSKGSDTVNNDNSTTVTYNNVFNIESIDPQQSADEIDKVLKEQNTRFKLAHGT